MNKIGSRDKKISLFIFVMSLAYYIFNCPPTITVEDSGDFVMGLSSLGIVHGPSFPLFTMLGFLFSKFPIGEMGFRIAFFSSIFGCLSLSLFYILQRLWNLRVEASLFTTAVLAVTSVYMGQSIIAEVYSLNMFFVMLLFIFTTISNRESSKRWVFLMGLTVGSGLIHHYPLFLTSCTGLIFYYDWKKLDFKKVLLGVLGIVLGLLPFLYLVVQMKNPDLDYNFGKVSNWEMLWKQFLRKGYQGVDQAGGGVKDKLLLSFSIIKNYGTDFTLAALLIPLGIFSIKDKKKSLALIVSFVSSSFLIVFLLGFTHEPHYVAVIKAYLMPNFLFAALYMGFFLDWLYKRDFKKKRIITLLLGLTFLLNGVFNFKRTSHFNDDFVYKWAEKGLLSLEPNSILILCGQEPYALYYANRFKKVRPDVTIYDRLSIMTKENLYAPHLLFWKVKTQEQFDNYRKFKELELFKNSKRPIYLTCADKFDSYGIVLKQTVYFHRLVSHIPFTPTELSNTLHQEVLDSALYSYPKTEYWLDSIRNMLLFKTFSYYLENNEPKIPAFLESLKKHKNSRDQDFMHSLLEDTYLKKKYIQYESLLKWNIELNGIESLQAGTLSRICTVRATSKKFKEALNYCNMAIKLSKECNVSLLNNLLFINYNLKDLSAATKWARVILSCKPDHKGANSLLKNIR